MNPLTDDEAALLYAVGRWGSAAYPIQKLQGSRWIIGAFRSWTGFPIVYRTKKAATEQFERWVDLALERWNDTKKPGTILTAVGIKETA